MTSLRVKNRFFAATTALRMVAKSYLSYQHLETIGVVASPECNIEVHPFLDICFTGANESVSVWDIKEGYVAHKLVPPVNDIDCLPVFDTVTCLAINKSNCAQLLAGYSDGRVRMWDWSSRKMLGTFVSHKGAVRTMAVSVDGQWLATGGVDGNIVIWDIFEQKGKFRLTAHQSSVTFLSFIHTRIAKDSEFHSFKTAPCAILSTGIDGLIKVWDLETETCTHVVSSHCTASIHTAYLLPDESELICGFANKNMEVFTLRPNEAEIQELVLTFSGTLERVSGSKRCNSFACAAVADDLVVPTDLLSRYCEGGLISFPNGILLSPHMDEFYVVDCRLAIFCTSFQRYAEIILVENHAGQKKRRLRLLARRVQKLQRKILRIQANQKLDNELKSILGRNWTSQQSDLEGKQMSQIERGIKLLQEIINNKQETDGALNSRETANNRKRKKRSATKPEEPLDEDEEREALDIVRASLQSSSIKIRILRERFDLIHKGLCCCSNGNITIFSTEQNNCEGYILTRGNFWMQAADVPKGNNGEALSLMERVTKNRRVLGDSQSLPHPSTMILVSYDDAMLVSLYSGGLTVWDVQTMKVKCKFQAKDFKPLCGMFLAGNDHLLIGDSKGRLQLYKISTFETIWTKQVSKSAVISISSKPDQTGFVIVDADKRLVVCNLKLVAKASLDIKIRMEAEVAEVPVCVKYSRDGNMIGVGLKDNTVLLMYADTLKLHVTLYGHSLPVTSLDFSTDGQMLATGSLDRHIKIWDAEFGNILRSLPASRNVAVTAVQFMFDTHYVISALGDGSVKLFDCDSGDRICTLQAGVSEIKSLATTEDSELIFGASTDGSIKIWERTDKQLILSEEREKEENQLLLKEQAASEVTLPGAATREVTMVTRATKQGVESVRDTERLIQVLSNAIAEKNNILGYQKYLADWEKSAFKSSLQAPPKPVPLIELLGRTPVDYVMHSVSLIPSEFLTETILGLPFKNAETLLDFMVEFLECFCALLGHETRNRLTLLLIRESELACRVALTIVQAHGRTLASTEAYRELLAKLNKLIKTSLDYQLSLMRRNQVALNFIAGKNQERISLEPSMTRA
eukprot:Gregarina_sp_Poly_1__7466@NODE_415_length_8738_cov_104_165725_g337_i0_p1_GENE_NODE_415_length_8738_cov_104_165725_g337_i0NODE_415_length_8738_cov_104_165725_g337_i0_p1_ORF_typecomplete_len1088_score174_56ANAPC4_WD40/PF12894_7/14ANAPC4_WD40/PF12894_7/8_2e14ANAPC4_WD40/PF12894_7/1_5ANAPC4_WD40/PF12894_7/6_1e02ANAPC4_WD40/PF12894_7/1_1e02ANAPC4_WD40/PF12894_7/0_073ANAPC4_WD40/PF12894_7/0_035ANAPC4_WD40/PF12894_7/2_2e11ANAPC4_WD40/PF12894_7/0_00048ANAPC4_WD40/PF12894_7/5_8e05WD40/PF00400_32/0_24WD40